MKIKQVFFRCHQNSCNYDGGNERNWMGENSYMIGETLRGNVVDEISYKEKLNHLFVQVYTCGKLYCEIPIQSVTRVYYGE